jgi:hypothetical protein
MERNLQDRFRRERPRILSSLCQGYLQPVSLWDLDVLDQIYQQCCQECTAVVTQLLASGTSTALSQHHANTLLTQPFDSYSLLQPGSTTLPQQAGMDLSQLQEQHPLTSHIQPNHFYSNTGSAGLTSIDYYTLPEQLDAGYAGAMPDFGLPPSARLY